MATLGAGSRSSDPHIRTVLVSTEQDRPVSWYERFVKRAFDLVVSSVLLVLLAPIMALVAILVRFRVGSPVLYAQWRVGRGGEMFRIYKFRTMIPDRRGESQSFHGPDRRLVHKSPEDPRVVPLGRTLRKFSLDELPQLWNVVVGDMSLVGPRPELPEIVDQYEDWQHARHAVRPGITCLWQVSSREDLLKDSTELDLCYIESMSLATDLKILFAMPAAAILGRNGF